MKLRLLTGEEVEDRLFDQPLDEQREYIAKAMNADPRYLPPEEADRLLAIRRLYGQKRFYRELGQMLSPNA